MPNNQTPLDTLLGSQSFVLMDGATGSELHRRGIPTPLPLWSTSALLDELGRQTLRQIHEDYASAGAQLITANTFRTHARNLHSTGIADQANQLTQAAVRIARQATAGSSALVAGSQAPLEDCYSPDLTPGDAELRKEHRQMANSLADAGVDMILIETMPTVREAVAAAEAATETRLPFAVSFVCGADGKLLSGETLQDAAAGVLPFGPRMLGVNCAPATKLRSIISQLKDELRELETNAAAVEIIAYGNVGEPDPGIGWKSTEAEQPDVYASLAASWLEQGVKVIGGCCGTTPGHIAALRASRRQFE